MSMNVNCWRLAGAVLACIAGATDAQAQSYLVDLGANNVFPLPAPGYVPVCVHCTGIAWNAVDSNFLGPTPLVDASGNFQGVTVTRQGGIGNFQFDSSVTPSGSDTEYLVDDVQNVGPVGSSTTWTFHGLPNTVYWVHVYSWAPDDPTYRTAITVGNGLRGTRTSGAPIVPPWTWTPGTNFEFDVAAAVNGEVSFTATTVLGFGTVNGFAIEPAICGTETTKQYCTAKMNSLGCTPAWTIFGASSAAATSGYTLRATQVLNNKPGLLLYGINGPDAVPFQGGYLCVKPPIFRSVAVNSGGSPPPLSNCTGWLQLDMNAFAAGVLGGNPRPELRVPCTRVSCQWWSRDPGFAPPNATSLSGGFQYFVCP